MDSQKELKAEGNACSQKHCCGCKAVAALLVLLLGGIIGYLIGHCGGHHGLCPVSGMYMPGPQGK